jgi:hypothetical protein
MRSWLVRDGTATWLPGEAGDSSLRVVLYHPGEGLDVGVAKVAMLHETALA